MKNSALRSRLPARSAWLIPLLGALVAFAPLSIDMYLPALPAIAREFGADAGAAQFTLAAYFIGMAFGQGFYGPLSDRFGRKPPLFVGLALYTLASAGCALAPDIEALYAWRFLQALGGCAGIVIPLAIVRDLHSQQDAARALSRLVLVMGVAPMLAPLAGAQLLDAWGWRSIFWILAGCGLSGLIAIRFMLAESLDARHAQSASVRQALRTYAGLLADRRYLGFGLAGSFASAGMFAYIAGSPFVLMELHRVSPQAYGWIFGVNACGLIAASQLNHRLLAARDAGQILNAALMALAAAGLLLLLAAYGFLPALPGLLLPLFGFVALLGFIGPNSSAGAMAGHAQRAGSASALLGTVRFGAASAAGAAVGALNDGTAHAMGAVMAVCGAAALMSYRMLVRRP
ncbi:MAG TPA: Bcr/CflA family multidrug efflux MFS transporter [Paucimonas sp.]|nr:Bcr/CflA family multidrug efflux MFS transporter [Paucimonas sp.]